MGSSATFLVVALPLPFFPPFLPPLAAGALAAGFLSLGLPVQQYIGEIVDLLADEMCEEEY